MQNRPMSGNFIVISFNLLAISRCADFPNIGNFLCSLIAEAIRTAVYYHHHGHVTNLASLSGKQKTVSKVFMP